MPLAIVILLLVSWIGLAAGRQFGSRFVCSLAQPVTTQMRLPTGLQQFGRLALAETLPGDIVLTVCIGAFTLAGFALAIILLGVVLGLAARWLPEPSR